MLNLKEIQSSQTLSRRAKEFNLYLINNEIIFICSACKYSTSIRRRLYHNYMKPVA